MRNIQTITISQNGQKQPPEKETMEFRTAEVKAQDRKMMTHHSILGVRRRTESVGIDRSPRSAGIRETGSIKIPIFSDSAGKRNDEKNSD
jgi:hypothetical protein